MFSSTRQILTNGYVKDSWHEESTAELNEAEAELTKLRADNAELASLVTRLTAALMSASAMVAEDTEIFRAVEVRLHELAAKYPEMAKELGVVPPKPEEIN